MKKRGFFIWACMVVSALLSTGCMKESGSLQNVVIISQQYRDAEVRNGDVLSLDYYCEFATDAEVVE